MTPFREIHERAYERKGDALLDRLIAPRSSQELRDLSDDRYLSQMARCVFQAGFVWRVIEQKWPAFEEAFASFAPPVLASWGVDEIQRLVNDAGIVRNQQKIVATLHNAAFVQRVADEYGSFGARIATWPSHDLVGLWDLLAKSGSRLGGDTGPRVLRGVGCDTFILTADVCAALRDAGAMDAGPTTKRGRQQAQAAFNTWQEESGLPYSHLSIIAACSVSG